MCLPTPPSWPVDVHVFSIYCFGFLQINTQKWNCLLIYSFCFKVYIYIFGISIATPAYFCLFVSISMKYLPFSLYFQFVCVFRYQVSLSLSLFFNPRQKIGLLILEGEKGRESERKRDREKEREREKDINRLPPICTLTMD